MMKISLLSRVAFICNCCLLLIILSKHVSFFPDGNVKNTFAILGYFLSFVVNICVNIWLAVRWWFKKNIPTGLPRWLLIVNILFFILQAYLLLR